MQKDQKDISKELDMFLRSGVLGRQPANKLCKKMDFLKKSFFLKLGKFIWQLYSNKFYTKFFTFTEDVSG